MTDVNIAVELLSDAHDGLFDVAFVISGDSDLAPPIRRVRERFPAKRVIVLFPPARYSAELAKAASAMKIGEAKLRHSQLPNEVVTARGHVVQRPSRWK